MYIRTWLGVMVMLTAVSAQAATPSAKRAVAPSSTKNATARPQTGAGKGTSKATQAPSQTTPDESASRESAAEFTWSKRVDAVDLDTRADVKRDEAIAKLKQLMAIITDGSQRAELMFRLSEMYWAKAAYLHLQAMQQWDQALDVWSAAGRKGREPKPEDNAAYAQSDAYRKEAMGLYEGILAQFPDYARKDEVLYNLGSALYETGDKKRGVAMYWKLLKEAPNSDFGADAWLQLGEHFFNANQLDNAIKAYAKAAETKKPRIYSYAMYKLAWCDYNQQDYRGALEKFRNVITYAKEQQGKATQHMGERDRVQLMNESLSDMVKTYSHLDAVDDAMKFYVSEVGKEGAYAYLSRLARLYQEEGKGGLQITMLQTLNRDYPYHAQAPQNQTAIMSAYAELGKLNEVRKEVRRLIDLYSPNGPWARRNADDPKVLESAFEVVEAELASLVTEQHRSAQSTKLTETYLLARDLYKEYLDKFTDTINSYKFRFFYAEILFELKEFPSAAEEYSLVVSSNPAGEFAKPAAYSAILAWEKVLSGVQEERGTKIVEGKRGKQKGQLAKLERIEKLKEGQTYAEEPLSDAERKLADACDQFVKVAPEDAEVVKVKFKSARLYFIHNQFEEAATRFGEIIAKWPKDELARLSAESILESFNVRKDWAQLNLWARNFRTQSVLMSDKGFAARITELVEGASFNEIHFVYEPKGDAKDTADRYSALAKEFPRSRFAMVSLYNSILNYDKANVLESAMAQADLLLRDYKNYTPPPPPEAADGTVVAKTETSTLPKPEEIREKTMFLDASFHERLALFEQSARLYEQYAVEFKTAPHRADALFNAGLFREGLGQYDQAVANFTTYVSDYPQQNDVADIAWRIGMIVEKKKDYAGMQRQFAAWAKTYGTKDPARGVCAEYKVAQAIALQGSLRDAQSAYDTVLAAYQRLPAEGKQMACPREGAAAAAFAKVEPEYQEYLSIDLSGDEREMAQKLIKKLKMVDSMQNRYTAVVSVGHGDYGIAALYRIGAMYQHLAKAIFDTPCPRRLDEDQCGIYQAELQAQAFPLEEKAIEAFDKALVKGYELGLYTTWLVKAQDALRTYEPQRFPEIHTYDLLAGESAAEIPVLVTNVSKESR